MNALRQNSSNEEKRELLHFLVDELDPDGLATQLVRLPEVRAKITDLREAQRCYRSKQGKLSLRRAAGGAA